MHKEIRKEMILRRKNFLPSLIVIFLLFTSIVSIVYFADPDSAFIIAIFFINLFGLFFFLFSILLASSKRGLILATCLTSFAIFRYLGIGNILNALLIAGLGIIAEVYAKFTKRTKKHISSNA